MPGITELAANKAMGYIQGLKGFDTAKRGYQTAKAVSGAIARDTVAGHKNWGFYSHAAIGAGGGAALGAGYTAYRGDGDYARRMMRGGLAGGAMGLGSRMAGNLYRSPTMRNTLRSADIAIGRKAQSWMDYRAGMRTAKDVAMI
jgi:hypothetical protein